MCETTTSRDLLWIGLTKLAPKAGNRSLEGAAGAWVHVVGCAPSREGFKRQLDGALDEFKFVLLDLKDVQCATGAEAFADVSEELDELARRVAEDGHLRFGTFYTFDAPN